MTNPDGLWEHCARTLRTQLGEATWLAWFDGVRLVEERPDLITVAVPAAMVKERIETRYLDMIATQLQEIQGSPVAIRLVVVTDRPMIEEPEVGLAAPEPIVSSSLSAPASMSTRADHVRLNPAYTFDAFVTGASNRFAEATAMAVAETPGSSYNPLFIYGGSGLGKTHLLHAIGNYTREHFPTKRVLYVPAEIFLNQFIEALRSKNTAAFKRHYRACDLFLMDDIDLIEGKPAAQEEFFHTFNDHYQTSNQIVLVCDRPPKSLRTFDERLTSRLAGGVMAPIQPPDLETRLAILGKKAERLPIPVPAVVLEYIATNIQDNIRELEGALIRVTAFASLNQEPLTLALGEKLLADVVAGRQARQLTPIMILDATAELFGFTVDELRSPSRRRPLVTARQVGMYVFRELTDYSYPAIAREFGGRDHTTVIHAVNKIGGLMAERRQIYEQVVELKRRLQAGG